MPHLKSLWHIIYKISQKKKKKQFLRQSLVPPNKQTLLHNAYVEEKYFTFLLFHFISFFYFIPCKHTTCIPRWKNTETVIPTSFQRGILFIYLFIYLFNNLFKVDKITKIQYAYMHKSSQANWLIKVNYPILQKKNLVIFRWKQKKKKKKVKQVCDVS